MSLKKIMLISALTTVTCIKPFNKPQFLLPKKDIEMIQAVQGGNSNQVKGLLKSGADINGVNQYGWTALMVASRDGRVDMVNLLLAAGADVQITTDMNALTMAALNSRVAVIELLLAHGAVVNTPTAYGDTALGYAVSSGNTQAVKLLIDAGADVNVTDITHRPGIKKVTNFLLGRYGTTPLMVAARDGYTDIVELLLAAGATVEVENKKGETAIFLAMKNGHTDSVDLLKKALNKLG